MDRRWIPFEAWKHSGRSDRALDWGSMRQTCFLGVVCLAGCDPVAWRLAGPDSETEHPSNLPDEEFFSDAFTPAPAVNA